MCMYSGVSTYERLDIRTFRLMNRSPRNIWTRLTNLDSSYELFFSFFLKLSHLRLKGKKGKISPSSGRRWNSSFPLVSMDRKEQIRIKWFSMHSYGKCRFDLRTAFQYGLSSQVKTPLYSRGVSPSISSFLCTR